MQERLDEARPPKAAAPKATDETGAAEETAEAEEAVDDGGEPTDEGAVEAATGVSSRA
jgi:hypothetical protein